MKSAVSITNATADGAVFESRSMYFIFSNDFDGTIAGGNFTGSDDWISLVADRADDTFFPVPYTIRTGSMRIVTGGMNITYQRRTTTDGTTTPPPGSNTFTEFRLFNPTTSLYHPITLEGAAGFVVINIGVGGASGPNTIADLRLYNTTTTLYHPITLEGPANAVTINIGVGGATGGTAFTEINLFNATTMLYHPVTVEGAAGALVLNIGTGF